MRVLSLSVSFMVSLFWLSAANVVALPVFSFKENTFLLALTGIPISYLYILGTKYTVESFGGILWPTRFIGFGIGIIIYALFVGMFFKEGITTKTFVSLILAFFRKFFRSWFSFSVLK